MPSLKFGLSNSYRVDGGSGKDGESFDDPETRLTDYSTRGSSLPADCRSISVKLLPSLRHSDPDLWTSKAIPKDVIETDYLVQPDSAGDKITTEPNSRQNAIAEPDSSVRSDVCRELQKAFLDGLDQRVISRRGRRNNGEASTCSLLLSADLLDRVSLDIVRMSEREPSGVSGCRLRTLIERQHSADMDLGCVRIDQDTEETFEIVLSLRECQRTGEKRHPGLIGNVSSLLSSVLSNSVHRGRVQPVEVYVGDAYQLEKIKLQKSSDSNNATNIVGLCSA